MALCYTFIDDISDALLPELIALYIAEDWWISATDNAALVRALVKGSHCFVLAMNGETVAGMGRAISDGVSDAYIQDITVRRDLRGQGIGSEIINKLQERLSCDGISWVALIAEKGSGPFYQRLGFTPMAGAIPMRCTGPSCNSKHLT